MVSFDDAAVLFRGTLRGEDCALSTKRLNLASGPPVDLADVVGARADGATVRLFVYAHFQAAAPSSSCCTAGGPALRERVVMTLPAGDAAEAARWVEAIRNALGYGSHQRRMLVLVNPKSGPGKAQSIFDECRQVLDDADVKLSVTITTHSGHAAELIRADTALDYDAIIICSGDGLMHEVLQGLMARPDRDAVVRRVALGVLPGGSGNGLAVTLCKAAGEARHAKSNAFLIAKGHTTPLDVAQVDSASGRLYSFLSLEVGMIADVDLQSEWLRSLGEARFTVQALLKLVKPRRIRRARISWTTEPSARCPDLAQPVPASWSTVEDDLYSLWACNCAWMSSSGNVAPMAKVNDGVMHLVTVRKSGPGGRMPRRALVEFLLGMETGAHIDAGCCEVVRATAFRVDMPEDAHNQIAVDGEAVRAGPVQFAVMPGYVRLVGAKS